ncbi:ATP-binding protein [Actinoplanes sp. NPDC051861]|uniref:ATP-binding protein n=1 Tax=Actinoplanes sp. NPDC051861 TaxID=3155170 RepID=UPI003443A7C8
MNLEDLRAVVRRGGVDEPTPLELAETLWLAAQMSPARVDAVPIADALPVPPEKERPRREPPPDPPESPPTAVPPPPPPAPPPVELHPYLPPAGRAREAALEEVPKPIELGDRLAFQRALHPLLRRMPVPGIGTLDEEATAQRAADQTVRHGEHARWQAVMRPAMRLWLDAVVVVDTGDSMAIWQDLATEIIAVLRESGVFRQVSRHRLDDDGGTARLTDWQGRAMPAGRLVDPVNRRVVLVVSDCVGPTWRSGSAGNVLRELARRGPVAILQPLPERLWGRTFARTVAGVLTAPRPCAPNSDLRFAAFGGRGRPAGTVVPVLEIDGAWLRRWTTLVAGGPPVTAAVTGVTSRPAGPAPDRPAGPAPTPDQRVRAFRAVASSEAFELARYVALGEPVLDVIRHVHHAMFRPALPAHLAEVLLSGLLRVEDSRLGRYRFVDGVPEVLTATLSVSQTLYANQLLERVSASVRSLSPGRDRFPALTPADGDEQLSTGSLPFAITPLGLRRVDLARRRLQHTPEPVAEPESTATAEPTVTVDVNSLFLPRTSPLAFRARDAEMTTLRDWCAGGGTSMVLLTGPPGAGKSRLAYELARHQVAAGWRVIGGAGQVPPGDAPVLIVADRADIYQDKILEPLPAPGDRAIRLLVIARSAGHWWRDVRIGMPDQPLRPSRTIELSSFGRDEDHAAYAREMVSELGERIFPEDGSAVSRARHAVGEPSAEDGATPLALALHASRALLGPAAAPVADFLLGRERQYAEHAAVQAEIPFADSDRLDAYLAAAQLYGAGTVTEAQDLVRGVGATDPEIIRRIVVWLSDLYPGDRQSYWAPLPPLLRERLAVPAVLRDRRLIAALATVSPAQGRRALDLLVPAARDRPDLLRALWQAADRQPALYATILDLAARTGGITPELFDLARGTMADADAPVAVLRAVADGLPHTSMLFTGQDTTTAQALTESFERLAAVSAPHRSGQAEAVRQRGLIWEREGRDDLALRAAAEEVELRRRLPGPASLARALTTYAERLDRSGQPVNGLVVINEALQVLDRLADDAVLARLRAYALVQKARLLGRADRGTEATEVARDATNRYRALEAADPRHRAGLTEALLIEAAQARSRGNRELAVRAGNEAVDRLTELATASPELRARLAYACGALGMDLADLGSHLAGLGLLDRAAALYRRLAAADPRHLPGLAAAGIGRGVLLADLERLDEAAEAFAGAAEVYRGLGEPYTSALAGVLTTQAEVNADAGRFDEATTLLLTACELRERLHNDDPLDARLRRDLAAGLQSLAWLYERRGDTEAARAPALRARLLRAD